jgi:hypothetical protein
MSEITHYDLCEKTAKWIFKRLNADVCVFEYASWKVSEQPDVLVFKDGYSTLFEIKISKSDFRADSKKPHRRNLQDIRKKRNSFVSDDRYYKDGKFVCEKRFYSAKDYLVKQVPHLGRKRYYVCPSGLISPNEINHFGLYWYKNDRFYLKKDSIRFRNNLMNENAILTSALVNQHNRENKNILIKNWSR